MSKERVGVYLFIGIALIVLSAILVDDGDKTVQFVRVCLFFIGIGFVTICLVRKWIIWVDSLGVFADGDNTAAGVSYFHRQNGIWRPDRLTDVPSLNDKLYYEGGLRLKLHFASDLIGIIIATLIAIGAVHVFYDC